MPKGRRRGQYQLSVAASTTRQPDAADRAVRRPDPLCRHRGRGDPRPAAGGILGPGLDGRPALLVAAGPPCRVRASPHPAASRARDSGRYPLVVEVSVGATPRSWWCAGPERQPDLRDRRHRGRHRGPGFLAGVWLHEGVDDRVQARLVDRGVRDDAEGEGPRGAEAPTRRPPPLADVRPPGPRTHTSSDFRIRPPFRLRWTFKAGHVLEFPPSIAYGRLARAAAGFFAVHHRTGKVIWQRRFNRSAASPTVAYRVVYHSWMQPLPCNRFPRNQPGQVVAMAARTGKIVWRYRAGVFESSPLVVGKTALRRLVGPQAPCGQHLHRQGPLDLHRRRRDQQLAGVREREGLLRHGRRQRLRAGRRTGRLRWRAQALSLRAPRVLPPRRRSRTAASSSGTPTARSTPSAPRAAGCCGPSGPATTSTRRLRSGGSGCTSARTTVSSWRSTRRPGTGCGASRPRPRSTARRASSTVSSTSPPARAVPQRLPVVQERRPRHLRLERAHREARLALARRRLQSRHRRQPAPLHRRRSRVFSFAPKNRRALRRQARRQRARRSRPDQVRVLENAAKVEQAEDRRPERRRADPQPARAPLRPQQPRRNGSHRTAASGTKG